ncbi:MAG: hypothetical protein ACRCVU_13740 [Flavobacterium sp.]
MNLYRIAYETLTRFTPSYCSIFADSESDAIAKFKTKHSEKVLRVSISWG